jgi:hypothetical protein
MRVEAIALAMVSQAMTLNAKAIGLVISPSEVLPFEACYDDIRDYYSL